MIRFAINIVVYDVLVIIGCIAAQLNDSEIRFVVIFSKRQRDIWDVIRKSFEISTESYFRKVNNKLRTRRLDDRAHAIKCVNEFLIDRATKKPNDVNGKKKEKDYVEESPYTFNKNSVQRSPFLYPLVTDHVYNAMTIVMYLLYSVSSYVERKRKNV